LSTNKILSPTTSTKKVKSILLGDVDGSNYINTSDARLLQQYVMGQKTLTAEQLVRANAYGDTVVDEKDVCAIVSYFAAQISALPYNGTLCKNLVFGDTNLSYGINAIDSLLIDKHINKVQLLTNPSFNYCVADVNFNGQIDNDDKTKIASAFVGATTLPDVSGFVPGDANGDGKVNSLDALTLSRCTNISYRNWLASDTDADGVVDGRDVYNIMRKFANAIPSLPVPPTEVRGELPANFASIPVCKWSNTIGGNANCNFLVERAYPRASASKK